jgi:hypothetical protein
MTGEVKKNRESGWGRRRKKEIPENVSSKALERQFPDAHDWNFCHDDDLGTAW